MVFLQLCFARETLEITELDFFFCSTDHADFIATRICKVLYLDHTYMYGVCMCRCVCVSGVKHAKDKPSETLNQPINAK